MLVKLNRSAQVSEAVGAASIVGAGEETGHKFHFASAAVEGCSTQDYELLILSVSFISMLLFFGECSYCCLALVLCSWSQSPENP